MEKASSLEGLAAEGAEAGTGEGQEVKRALVITAHPDDSEFGCGGTAALWSHQGWEFYQLVCSNGSKGSADPQMPPERLAPLRREEQRAAARRLGVKDVSFLDYEDGELTYSRELLGQVVRHIRLIRPYAVFTHDPETVIVRDSFVNHSDHRCAGLVAIDAVYPAARDRWNFPEHLDEGLEPHNVKEIYIWSFDKANFTVDITDVVDLKIQALMEHKTQFGEGTEFLKFVKERWRDESGRYLERFRRVVLFR